MIMIQRLLSNLLVPYARATFIMPKISNSSVNVPVIEHANK